MRKQVEALEDHADLPTLLSDVPLVQLIERAVGLPIPDELAIDG